MGVKLKPLLESTTIPLSDLKGATVAIDGMNMLFQILYNPAQRKFASQKQLPYTFYTDSTKRVITHIYGWLQKVSGFYKAGIKPIVVFDGKPDKYKRLVTKNYARDFREIEKMYKQALAQGDYKSAAGHALSKTYMWTNCLRESKLILESCGVPVVMAPSEAEAQCAALAMAGAADFAVSNDYDTLLFGAPKVIRKLTFQTQKRVNGRWRSVTPDLKVLDLQNSLQTLGITRAQLVDLGILIGCDYFRGIPQLGPKRSLEAIRAYRKIEPMVAKHPDLFTELPQNKLAAIRKLFLHPEVRAVRAVQVGNFARPALEVLCLEEHTLNLDKVEKALNKAEKAHRLYLKRYPENIPDLSAAADFDNSLAPLPPGTNIHLQRRLKRAKVKKNIPKNLPTGFTAASDLRPSRVPKKTVRVKKTRKKIIL